MFHVAAVAVVFGTIAILDLRLTGIAFLDFAVTDLSRQVLPWTWTAFVIAAITGVLMFSGQAVKYADELRVPGQARPDGHRGSQRAGVSLHHVSGRCEMGSRRPGAVVRQARRRAVVL